MSNSIKDEKAESDRRAALQEEEDNEEVESGVVGGEGKGEAKGDDKMMVVEGEESETSILVGLDPTAKSFEPNSNGGLDRVEEGFEEEREEGETIVGEEDVEMEDIVELEEGQEREEKEEGEMLSQ